MPYDYPPAPPAEPRPVRTMQVYFFRSAALCVPMQICFAANSPCIARSKSGLAKRSRSGRIVKILGGVVRGAVAVGDVAPLGRDLVEQVEEDVLAGSAFD